VSLERRFLTAAVAHDVPVLGICFGCQLLAQVLGGRVVPSPEAKMGRSILQTDDQSVVAPAPWLLWHEEAVETSDLVSAWIDDAQRRDEVSPEQCRGLWENIDALTKTSAANAADHFTGFLRRAGLLDADDRSAIAAPVEPGVT
jgi:hypothetical protein